MKPQQWRTLAMFAGMCLLVSFWNPQVAWALLGVTGFLLVARRLQSGGFGTTPGGKTA